MAKVLIKEPNLNLEAMLFIRFVIQELVHRSSTRLLNSFKEIRFISEAMRPNQFILIKQSKGKGLLY